MVNGMLLEMCPIQTSSLIVSPLKIYYVEIMQHTSMFSTEKWQEVLNGWHLAWILSRIGGSSTWCSILRQSSIFSMRFLSRSILTVGICLSIMWDYINFIINFLYRWWWFGQNLQSSTSFRRGWHLTVLVFPMLFWFFPSMFLI